MKALASDYPDTVVRTFVRVSDLDELWAGEMIGLEVDGTKILSFIPTTE